MNDTNLKLLAEGAMMASRRCSGVELGKCIENTYHKLVLKDNRDSREEFNRKQSEEAGSPPLRD
jgi:hypothetical protein